MPWEKGKSGNPAGRPRGSENQALRSLLMPHAPALIEKAVNLALDGDRVALRLCLERILPAIKPSPAPIYSSVFKRESELTDRVEIILEEAERGKITFDEAFTLLQILEKAIAIKEIAEFDQRLQKLEEKRQ